jgi:uncharacterized membrane-anchored protein YhcB (DUF1043 family)
MFVSRSLPKFKLNVSSKKIITMSNSSKAVVSFIVGAAVGVAVGYFLNSDKKDELVDKLKYQTDKLKDRFKKRREQFEDAIENELA